MEIKTIMKRLETSQSDDGGVKTASDRTATATPNQLQDQLRASLRAVTAGTGTTKTASAVPTPGQSPTGDLVKMAADLSNAEEEALVKQAQLYGAAMCDGFMARYGQYETAAAGTKTAAVVSTPIDTGVSAIAKYASDQGDHEFAKFASENPDLVKEAFDLGYQRKMDELTKTATASMEQGYNDTLNEIHKLASDNYKKGSAHAQYVVRQAQSA
jgi:hypothetical protein